MVYKRYFGEHHISYQPDPNEKYFLGFGLTKCAESIEYYGYQDHFSNPLEDSFVETNSTVTDDLYESALRLVFK